VPPSQGAGWRACSCETRFPSISLLTICAPNLELCTLLLLEAMLLRVVYRQDVGSHQKGGGRGRPDRLSSPCGCSTREREREQGSSMQYDVVIFLSTPSHRFSLSVLAKKYLAYQALVSGALKFLTQFHDTHNL
jgi:hypothetical protein